MQANYRAQATLCGVFAKYDTLCYRSDMGGSMQAREKKQVLIRVTPEEHKQIKAAAAAAHQSLSAYLTSAGLERAKAVKS